MYVVFEGIEGSGKDTQADMLLSAWTKPGSFPFRINEPDDDMPIGKLLRQFLASGTSPKAHAALFLADRLALHFGRILPAINVGSHVISSRSFLSTLVYQQEQWPLDWLFDMHRMLPTKVDAFIILDVDPDEGLVRVDSRGKKREYYEAIEFQKKNRQRYLELAEDPRLQGYLAEGGQVFVIHTTNKSAQEVHRLVRTCLESLKG